MKNDYSQKRIVHESSVLITALRKCKSYFTEYHKILLQEKQKLSKTTGLEDEKLINQVRLDQIERFGMWFDCNMPKLSNKVKYDYDSD